MVSKQDQKEMEESLSETTANVGDSSLSTVPKDQSLAIPGQFRGVNIEGLTDIPASMVAVPYCRLIQPTSKNTEMEVGGDAPVGTFLFNDIQEAVRELNFVLLRAKHQMRKVDENGKFVGDDYIGKTVLKPQVSILGITTDSDKLFILSLSSTSFTSFGKLIAKFKSLGLDKTYRLSLTATSEKKENDKGKYFIVNFQINKELSSKEIEHMGKIAFEYGLVLDRQIVEDEV